MLTTILITVMLLFGISGFFLKYLLRSNISTSSCLIPFFTMLLGLSASAMLRDFSEALIFLTAATAQFASFVFVSRLRQRGSFFWHMVASLAANGTWYATMHALDSAKAYWWLYLIYVVGIVVGRVAGAGWAQYIEQKFNLKSDATRDPRLASGQRMKFIIKEWTFWVLAFALLVYFLYGFLFFEQPMFKALLIVMCLALLQNFAYALNTRAAQRGNNWIIATTGLLSGLTFYISSAYLFSKNMPLLLLIPYMLSTTLGSISGAALSMIIEWAIKSSPDQHLNKSKETKPWHDKLPYIIFLSLVASWLVFQKSIFGLFNIPLSKLAFPLPMLDTGSIPYTIVIISVSVLFFMDSILQTLMSRAGSRNHTGYHVATCIPKGLVDFARASYISLNPKILEIVPVAIFSGCLGSLFGKDISERIEKWLQARMDTEQTVS